MAQILTVTTTAAVRAVLGISEESKEMTDQYFVDHSIAGALRLELATWLPTPWATLVQAATASADDDSVASRIVEAVRQASAYWCAWEVMATGNLTTFLSNEDGQNKIARNPLDLAAFVASLNSSYLRYRDLALALITQVATASAAPAWMIGKSVPTFDPVTG